MDKKYVQYGCGFSAPSEWINYDASPTLYYERIPIIGKLYTRNNIRFPENVKFGDIIKGLPEEQDSCDGVYCSHVLEHLSYEDFIIAIKNTYSILKSGGIFRGVVPDLKAAVIDYLNDFETTESPADHLMRGTMLGIEKRGKSFSSFIKSFYGNSKHLWMWDYKSLAFELNKIGFKNIRPAKFNDSTDSHFNYVEEEGRFYKAAAFECIK